MKDQTDILSSSRKDGLKTQKLLMKAAGKMFAERGFAEATSKEICKLAKTNQAAVNYYFGGKINLYKAVLAEAHKQFIDIEELAQIYKEKISPEEKLRRFFYKFLRVAQSPSKSWAIKVFLRELATPSRVIGNELTSIIHPKATFIKKIVADLINSTSEDSRQVQHALAFTIFPLLGFILFPPLVRSKILPDANISSPSFHEEFVNYLLTGLRSLKQDPQLSLFFPPYS